MTDSEWHRKTMSVPSSDNRVEMQHNVDNMAQVMLTFRAYQHAAPPEGEAGVGV